MRAKLLSFTIFVFWLVFSADAQSLTVRQIMAEPSIAGMRPESERISPDGRWIAFLWNAEGKNPRNLYVVSSSDGKASLLVDASKNYEEQSTSTESRLNYGLVVRDDFVKAREKNLSGIEFSPDSRKILFVQNGDIYIVDVETSELKRITRTQSVETQARWLNSSSIIFSSAGNFFAFDFEKNFLVQVTKEANPAAFLTITSGVASKDGKLFAYVLTDGSKQRSLIVPNYLDEFVQAPSFRRGWTEQKVFVTRPDGSLGKPFEVKLPKPEGNFYIRSIKWASDNKSLVIDRIDRDTKRRQILFVKEVGKEEEKILLVEEEVDEKWIAPLSRIVEPHPKDISKILFASEKSGFNHLYLANIDFNKEQVSKIQLTQGNWEVDWAKWANSDFVVYSSTEKNTAEREFYLLELNQNRKTKVATFGEGMKTNPQLSEDESNRVLLYSFSTWKTPTELYAVKLFCHKDVKCLPIKLTNSVPTGFLQRKWNEPKFIDIPTRDGKLIKSKVYLPGNFSPKKKYPMVIFIHGAGYLQNTINGWNNYYREFMFNQLLTEQGYIVLDIDYRGSAGYGRDWRTDVYGFLGGKDYEDHLDAVDFMVKNYSVDPKRIGVYGGSYGGFLSAMLVMRAPDKIACAAALRPVFDWKNYFYSSPIYTTERLGYPDKNPDFYKRSSPISYAENLQKPLLILHGLLDDNVHAQDSIQLIEKLIRLEKTKFFDAMLYPSENHGFQRPTSWADEYERILMFFEKHLK
jgi:dipeptidyl aminopeptidase/acylaminoacyl peptidase